MNQGAGPQGGFAFVQVDPVDRIVAGKVGFIPVTALVQVAGQDHGNRIGGRAARIGHADPCLFRQPVRHDDFFIEGGNMHVGNRFAASPRIVPDDGLAFHKQPGFLHQADAATGRSRMVALNGGCAGAPDGSPVVNAAAQSAPGGIAGKRRIPKPYVAGVPDAAAVIVGGVVPDDRFVLDHQGSLVEYTAAAIGVGGLFRVFHLVPGDFTVFNRQVAGGPVADCAAVMGGGAVPDPDIGQRQRSFIVNRAAEALVVFIFHNVAAGNGHIADVSPCAAPDPEGAAVVVRKIAGECAARNAQVAAVHHDGAAVRAVGPLVGARIPSGRVVAERTALDIQGAGFHINGAAGLFTYRVAGDLPAGNGNASAFQVNTATVRHGAVPGDGSPFHDKRSAVYHYSAAAGGCASGKGAAVHGECRPASDRHRAAAANGNTLVNGSAVHHKGSAVRQANRAAHTGQQVFQRSAFQHDGSAFCRKQGVHLGDFPGLGAAAVPDGQRSVPDAQGEFHLFDVGVLVQGMPVQVQGDRLLQFNGGLAVRNLDIRGQLDDCVRRGDGGFEPVEIADTDHGVIRYGNHVGHACNGHLHPFLRGKSPVGINDPFAGFVGGGEQFRIADRYCLCRSGQSGACQDFRQRNHRSAFQHILQAVIGKLHRIQGKSVRQGRNGFCFGVHLSIQFFRGQGAAFLFRHMVDICFQVLIRSFRQGEGYGNLFPFRRLDLVSFRVQHLDIKGVGNNDGLLLIPDLSDGLVRLPFPVNGNLPDGQHRALRERAGFSLNRHNHAGHGLLFRKSRGFLFLRCFSVVFFRNTFQSGLFPLRQVFAGRFVLRRLVFSRLFVRCLFVGRFFPGRPFLGQLFFGFFTCRLIVCRLVVRGLFVGWFFARRLFPGQFFFVFIPGRPVLRRLFVRRLFVCRFFVRRLFLGYLFFVFITG